MLDVALCSCSLVLSLGGFDAIAAIVVVLVFAVAFVVVVNCYGVAVATTAQPQYRTPRTLSHTILRFV